MSRSTKKPSERGIRSEKVFGTVAPNSKTMLLLSSHAVRLLTQDDEEYICVVKDPDTEAISLVPIRVPPGTVAVSKLLSLDSSASRVAVSNVVEGYAKGRYEMKWDDIVGAMRMSSVLMGREPKI